MRTHFLFALLFLCALPSMSKAQENDSTTLAHKPRGLSRFLQRFIETDSQYVKPNHYNCCAMLMGDMHYNFYKISAEDDTHNSQQSLYIAPYTSMRVGPYVGYSLVFLGYTFNLGTRPATSNRSNIYLSIYSPIIGIDYYYERGVNNYKIKRVSGFNDYSDAQAVRNTSFPGLDTYLRNFHVYYVFNHKRFSYTAAYSQSTEQLHSSGSFMLGFNWSKQRIHFDYTQLPSQLLQDNSGNSILLDGLKLSQINYQDYSLSLGYSYNWVFAPHFLYNITLTPTLGYNINRGDKIELNKHIFSREQLNIDLISRSAIVWNNGHFFAGASAVAHTYSYRKSSFSILNAQFQANIYAGFNFWAKKKYRHKKNATH